MDRFKITKKAHDLFDTHKLRHWKFEILPVDQLGGCYYDKLTIILDTFYVDNNYEELVYDTLLHEVAHALTPGHQHDHIWRAMAIQLGCDPDQNYDGIFHH